MDMRLLLVLLLVLAAGCGGSGASEKKGAEKKESSTGELLIDGVTRRHAVRAGQKAKRTLERVSDRKKKDLDQVFE